ncbi:MAG: hypothetical protein IJS81_12615 [Selenomonadaceae bacterium]|nr:hypothetical protein [Selenomonadaceae bacterium]
MVNYDGLYNKDFYREEIQANHFYDKKLHFKIIDNGTILPHKMLKGAWNWGFGGIVDEKNNFIKSSFEVTGWGGAYTPTEDIKFVPETVVYLGTFFHIWAHCLTDNIKRVWFLKSEIYKKALKKCPVVFVPMIEFMGGGQRPQLYAVVANFGS